MYVRKQREYRAAGVSQVEIDLTRCGDRSLVFPMTHIPRQHRTLYLSVCDEDGSPQRSKRIRRHCRNLPTVGVLLDASVADAPLNLQSLLTHCYRNGRYNDLDYRKDLEPPLPSDEATWTDELLRAAGLR
jgi:hypothetical protein